MPDWIFESCKFATDRLLEHAAIVGLSNTEEFTFRSFFMVAASKVLDQPVQFHTEWQKYDLLVQCAGNNTLLEFKYYIYRQTVALDGKPTGWKGGPSSKNESEFQGCIEKLARTQLPEIHERRLVLVYERGSQPGRKYSYEKSYSQLCPNDKVRNVTGLDGETLGCRILSIK